MAEWILDQQVTCGKLKMSPTACHGCPDNPAGNDEQERDQQALEEHAHEIVDIAELYDAVRLGLIRDTEDVDAIDFQMLRSYSGHMDAMRTQAGMRF